MRLFDKRPLSLILCITLAVFVFFANSDKAYAIFIAAGTSVFVFIVSFIFPRIFRGAKGAIRIAAILVIPTLFISNIYFNSYFKADLRFGEESVKITGFVHEIDKKSSTTTDTAIIKTTDIDSAPYSKYTLIAYFTKEESQRLTAGTEITLVGSISGFSDSTHNYGKGISAKITDIENLTVDGYRELSVTNVITDYREWLCRNIVLLSGDTYSGGLLSALLIGEQSYLEPGLKSEFKMIGVSHVLALSGMHMAIICLGFGKLLDALHVKRKIRCAAVILFTLLYMAFTGFSSSVTRAGIMLILSSLLYILSRSHDSVTSLFISVAIIVLIEPYSIFDISLWLSAFATLGVVVACEAFSEYDKNKNVIIRLLRYILISLLSSLFAICATLLLSHVYFGRISVIAPINALIFGVLAEFYMYSGPVCILISLIRPVTSFLVHQYNIISELSEFLAGIDYVYVYTSFVAVEILITVTSVAFILFLILNVKKKGVAALVLFALLFSVYTTSYFMTRYQLSDDAIYYSVGEYGDTFTAISGGRVAIVDSKIHTKSVGYENVDLIEASYISQIDLYILPVYYHSMTDMIEVILENTKIHTILLPTPINETEDEIKNNVTELCDSRGIALKLLENDSVTTMGDFHYTPVFKTPCGDGVQEYVYVIRLGENFCTYISCGFMDSDQSIHAVKAFMGSNTLIFGSHGSKYTESELFGYYVPDIEKIIFNSKNYSLDEYLLDFYERENTKIYYDVVSLKLFE